MSIIEKIQISNSGVVTHSLLTEDELSDIASVINNFGKEQLVGFIPKNVVYLDQSIGKIVWWVPPRKVKINHKIKDWPANLTFVFPALMMMDFSHSLYVMGFNHKKEIDRHTDLHSLLLPNYDNSNGWNCLSSKVIADKDMESLIAARTMQFYTWKFNSWAHNESDKKLKEIAFKEYTRERPKDDLSFNISKLPSRCSLEEFINIT